MFFIYCFQKFLTSFVFFLLGGAGLETGVGSFWVFGVLPWKCREEKFGDRYRKHSAHFCFDDQAFYHGGEFDALVVVVGLRIFVSMIKLSSGRRI